MILPSTVSACVLSAAVLATAAMAEPKRLAIYYGIPSLVNGAGGDIGRAAAEAGEGWVRVEEIGCAQTPAGSEE